MGWKNGRYVLDLEPLSRVFRNAFKPKPKAPPKPKTPSTGSLLRDRNKMIRDLTEGKY